MAESSYGQFCPVAMASEILCSRWTMLVVRELVCGSTRFNDLRRGLPRMSPALLSKRLKELEAAGVIRRVVVKDEPGPFEYHLTRAGRDLRAIVEAMGIWGQTWVGAGATLQNLDPSLLMWDIRRRIDPTPMLPRRCVIQFLYPELPQNCRRYWLITTPGMDVDLCTVDPGFEVDLFVRTDIRTMTAVWMGLMTPAEAIDSGKLVLTGERALGRSIGQWLKFSPFAGQKKLAVS